MPVEPHLAAPQAGRHTAARWFAFASLATITIAWAPLGNTAAYVSMLFALVAVLVGWRQEALVRVVQQRWVWTFLAAFCLMALAFLLNSDPGDLIYIGDFIFLPFCIIFALAFSLLKGRVGVEQVAWLLLLGALLATAVGVSDVYVQGQDRAHGFSNSPIHFANIAVIVGFMALAGVFIRARGPSLWLYAGPILGIAAATLAGTRGAYFVAAILAAVFAIFVISRRRERLSVKLAGLALLALVLVLAIFAGHALGFTRPLETFAIVQEFFSGNLSDNSTAYRLAMYQSGVRAYLDAPLFGHGWHNQVTAALPYMDGFARAGYAAEQWSYIHNEMLGFALSGGVFGIAAFFCIMLAPLIGLRGLPADDYVVGRTYLVITMLAGVFAGGLTDVLFMTELSKIFYVALTAAVLILCVSPFTFTSDDTHE